MKRMKTSSKTIPKGHKKSNKILIPRELEIAFFQTLSVLSDNMIKSTFEADLATQLTMSYMQHLNWGNEVSYENLSEHVATLQWYLKYKQYNKNDNPLLALAIKNFDSTKIPTTCEEVLAALMLHHLSGEKGMHLFDAFIYSSFLADYHGKDKELQRLATEALTAGLNYIQSISEWNSSATMEMMFGGDKERISKPSSSPDEILSAVAEELDHSHSDKMEVSLPHEVPIGSNVVEPKGATTKKGDLIGASEYKKLPIIKEPVGSPKSENGKQPSTLTKLIEKLQNPLASTAESWWLKDLLNLRKEYENSGSEASLSQLKSRETLLTFYLQFKYKLSLAQSSLGNVKPLIAMQSWSSLPSKILLFPFRSTLCPAC
jgi:hypothetical protein